MNNHKELLDGLRQAPLILAEFVQNISSDNLHLRRGEGFWTIAEHLSHLAEVQLVFIERMERFIHEEHPVFVRFIPDKEKKDASAPVCLSVPQALEQFAACRKKQIAILEIIDDATWQKTGTHPEYETYSFSFLMRHALAHDYWHLYRMEALWQLKDAYLTGLD